MARACRVGHEGGLTASSRDAIVLGLGRALGETMALAMFVGSANKISPSLFSPADTLAALLANKFPEAASPLDLGVLLALTLLVKVAGEMVMNHRSSAEGVRAHPGAAR